MKSDMTSEIVPSTGRVINYEPAPNENEKPTVSPSTSAQADADETEPASAPFPVDCLPPVVANIARAISEATKTPPTLAACSCLGVLSASIGKGLRVESSKTGRITPGNLYILASARTGTGKSEAFRHAAAPLQAAEEKLIEGWKKHTLPGAKAELGLLEMIIKKTKEEATQCTGKLDRERLKDALKNMEARRDALQSLLVMPALCSEDATQEALAELLARNDECLASMSSDAGNVVNNLLGRYSKKADQTDENIYLKAYSLERFKQDRKTSLPVHLNEPCLSTTWLTQPDKVDRLLASRALTDGGLLPRFLPCHTDCQPQPITGDERPIPAYHKQAWEELVTINLQTYRRAETPCIVKPTEDALRCMVEFHNKIVARRNGDLRDADGYAARWAENAWRVALCLHAGRWGAEAKDKELVAETAQAAIKIMEWFATQQLEILAAGRAAAEQERRNKVSERLSGQPDGITARDVYHRFKIVATPAEADALLERMHADGLLDRDDRTTGGRRKVVYFSRAAQN